MLATTERNPDNHTRPRDGPLAASRIGTGPGRQWRDNFVCIAGLAAVTTKRHQLRRSQMFIDAAGDPKTKAPEERNAVSEGSPSNTPLLRSCEPLSSPVTINISSLRDWWLWLELCQQEPS